MNKYELILLFDLALGEEKIGQLVSKVEDKIKSFGGEILKTEKWGARRPLSRIKKAKRLNTAYYVFIRFDSEPALPAELKAFLKVTENVVRSFISRAVDFPKPAETRIAGIPIEAVSVGEIKPVEGEVKRGES